MKSLFNKNLLYYAGAVALFLVITFVFFYPMLEGKKLKATDTSTYIGGSKEISDFRKSSGEEPLWTNSLFSGMPTYQISTIWKGQYLSQVDKIFTLFLKPPAKQVFLYFVGFFVLLLVLGFGIWPAILGATAYAMSSYFFIILEAGHGTKAHAIGYIPLILAGIILAFKGKYLLGAILATFAIGLQLSANHLQITYYTLIIVLTFGISELIFAFKEKQLPSFLKATGVLTVAAIFAVLMNFSNLWATNEYGKYTIRGKSELADNQQNKTSGLDLDYATQWSYGIAETMTLAIPDFMGGSSSRGLEKNSKSYEALINNGIAGNQATQIISSLPVYWGPQPFTSGPVYVGAIIVFLFIVGVFIVENRFKWWLVAGTVISIILAWGHNLMPVTEFFMNYFPGYNKFRAVSMTLVIAEFTMPFLALLAVKKVLENRDNIKTRKDVFLSFYIIGGLLLIFAVFGGTFFNFSGSSDPQLIKMGYPEWLIEALRNDRQSILQRDALRSLIFVLLAFGLLWAFFTKKIKGQHLIIGLFVLVLIDMGAVNWRYLNHDKFENPSAVSNPFPRTAADDYILKNDKDPNFRVFNTTVSPFNDASTSYYHKSIGGYHGAKLRRYQDIIDRYLTKGNQEVFNMLNTKYFIMSDKNKAPIAQLNPEAFGNAWAVKELLLVDNADSEIEALGQSDVDLKSTAVVDKRFAADLNNFKPNSDTTCSIKLNNYAPNNLKYAFNSSKPELVVFSEIYYEKGWNAYIDGELKPHFRANYVLRAMIIPAGKHQIEFKFEPAVYNTGGLVAAGSSLLVFLTVLAYLAFYIRESLKNKSIKS